MKITSTVETNLKVPAALLIINNAAQKAMRDTVVEIHNDTIKNAAIVKFWDTGHNARSIASEVSGMGVVQKGADAQPERVVDDSKLEGAIYSTSGYGGWGEIGTARMAARPYFKPALDKNFTESKFGEKIKRYLK